MSKETKSTKSSSTTKKKESGTSSKKPASKSTTTAAKKATTTTAKKPTAPTAKKTTTTTAKPSAAKKTAAPAKKPTSTPAKKSTPSTTKKTTAKPTSSTTSVKKKVVKKKPTTTDEGPLEYYLKAGEISIKVKEYMRGLVKVGASVLELCELGEAKIKELGGNWAFPLNISINNIAAHYSAPPEDELIIMEGDLVKIDCGVQVNGYVADTAFTVSFGKDHKDLIKASEEATKAAVDMIRPGITTDRLGEEIEDIIRSYDFRPIRELTGHQLDQNLLHGPVTIPNVKGMKEIKLEEGQAFAIETFATDGTGKLVKGDNRCFIYQLNPIPAPIRLEFARKARKVILAEYSYFPFTTRWIAKELSVPTAIIALKNLADKGQIKQYPVLSDIEGSLVSQSEHTVYLTENSRVVTTRPNE
ncbi:MAG: type II methionyl aminopeptidase [Asgard group archaeon]|nr:type II methionyl aminopeptidase [Asgard group archaeon]